MTGLQPADARLAQTFVELTDTLVEDFDVVDLMVLLTERCVELLDAAAAGLLLADSTALCPGGGHERGHSRRSSCFRSSRTRVPAATVSTAGPR